MAPPGRWGAWHACARVLPLLPRSQRCLLHPRACLPTPGWPASGSSRCAVPAPHPLVHPPLPARPTPRAAPMCAPIRTWRPQCRWRPRWPLSWGRWVLMVLASEYWGWAGGAHPAHSCSAWLERSDPHPAAQTPPPPPPAAAVLAPPRLLRLPGGLAGGPADGLVAGGSHYCHCVRNRGRRRHAGGAAPCCPHGGVGDGLGRGGAVGVSALGEGVQAALVLEVEAASCSAVAALLEKQSVPGLPLPAPSACLPPPCRPCPRPQPAQAGSGAGLPVSRRRAPPPLLRD